VLVVQEWDEPELNETELPPSAADLEAKVDIFFFTCPLAQTGQMTWFIWLLLNTKSSKLV